MDNIGKDIRLKFEPAKQQAPKVNYDKVINTIGTVGSSATAIYAYRSYESKQVQQKITKFEYAEKLRKAILQGEMSRERAQIMCREIGIQESVLDPMGTETSKPRQTRFASVTVSNPVCIGFQSYFVPENKMKIGVAAIIGILSYFTLLRIVKFVVKLIGER